MSANIESSAVISNDGILIISDMDSNLYPESFAAMASVVRNTAFLSMKAIGNSSIYRLTVETNDGSKMVTLCAGSKVMVIAVINPGENADSNMAKLEQTADTVKSYFE